MIAFLDSTIPVIGPHVSDGSLSQGISASRVAGGLRHLRAAIRNQKLFENAHPVMCDLLNLQELSRRHITQVATFFKSTHTFLQYEEMLLPVNVEAASGKL